MPDTERLLCEYGELVGLAKRAVEQAWKVGRLLAELEAGHAGGEWQTALDKAGVPKHAARRLGGLAIKYPECDTMTHFASVAEALRAREAE